MAGRKGTYVLALRREAREMAPADWQQLVRAVPGVRAGSAASPDRMQVEADSEAIEKVRAELGELVIIERLAFRRLQSD